MTNDPASVPLCPACDHPADWHTEGGCITVPSPPYCACDFTEEQALTPPSEGASDE